MSKLLKTGIDAAVKELVEYVKRKRSPKLRKPRPQQRKRPQDCRIVSVPVARTKIMSHIEPKMSMSADRLVVRHRELIASNVVNTSTFSVNTSYILNPAASTVFPWLAPIASNYEFYQWKSLRFEYVPYAATSVAGEIMMAIDYDPAESVPPSETVLSSYNGFKATPVWKGDSIQLSTELATSFVKWHYCYNGYTATDPNAQQYNVGTMYLASNNGNNATVGKLYAYYEVELKNPTLSPLGVFGNPDGGRFQGISGYSSILPFGTSSTKLSGTLGFDMSAIGGMGNTLYVYNPGTYVLIINMSGTGLSAGLSITQYGGASASTMSNLSINTNSGGTGSTYVFNLQTSAPCTLLFTGVTNTTITAGVLYIAETPILVS